MQTDKPKILIVEDDEDYQESYKRRLGDATQILAAFSIPQARALFLQHAADIKLIVMDACVPGDSPTTPPLVREIREHFNGPMIAASSMPYYRNQLVAAGCDHQSPKEGVSETVLHLLAEMPAPIVNRPDVVRGTALPGGTALG